jgi:hypothetical protein
VSHRNGRCLWPNHQNARRLCYSHLSLSGSRTPTAERCIWKHTVLTHPELFERYPLRFSKFLWAVDLRSVSCKMSDHRWVVCIATTNKYSSMITRLLSSYKGNSVHLDVSSRLFYCPPSRPQLSSYAFFLCIQRFAWLTQQLNLFTFLVRICPLHSIQWSTSPILLPTECLAPTRHCKDLFVAWNFPDADRKFNSGISCSCKTLQKINSGISTLRATGSLRFTILSPRKISDLVLSPSAITLLKNTASPFHVRFWKFCV